MKKKVIIIIAVILIVCLLVVVLVKCNNGKDSGVVTTPTNSQKLQETGASKEYKEPDFIEEAGYNVIKSDNLSYIKYNGIHLLDKSNGQLDLELDGGRLATLLIKKSEDYIDESEITNLQIGDYEVKLSEGLDNINRYYWKKDNVSYIFSINKETNISNDEILKIINGFSIEAGENY